MEQPGRGSLGAAVARILVSASLPTFAQRASGDTMAMAGYFLGVMSAKKGAAPAAPYSPAESSSLLVLDSPPLRHDHDAGAKRCMTTAMAVAARVRHRKNSTDLSNAAGPQVPVRRQRC